MHFKAGCYYNLPPELEDECRECWELAPEPEPVPVDNSWDVPAEVDDLTSFLEEDDDA
jgi:hypothetical protein